MAKDPKEKELSENSSTPGAGLTKSEETIQKTKELTDKLNEVSGKATLGLTYARLARDGISAVRQLIGEVDSMTYEEERELRKQAKNKAIAFIKEQLPTRQEIIEKLLGYSCEPEVIRVVTLVKEEVEKGLNLAKEIGESVVDKLKKIQRATDYINTIGIILAVFQALVIAFEILITAASLALQFFVGIFSSAGAEKLINDAIKKAESIVLKYTEAVKSFTRKCLKIVGRLMIIFNLVPQIIRLFDRLLTMIKGYIDLLNRLFNEYIQGCIPDGELVTDNDDGTSTVNIDKLNNFLDSGVASLSGGDINKTPDIYGDYIRDEKTQRIFRPKIN